MSEIDSLVGGKYIFFKTMASNKALSTRLGQVSLAIGGSAGDGTTTIKKGKNFKQFQAFMNSYLNKLSTIANYMRASELKFIEDSIANLDSSKSAIINEDIKKGLEALQNGKITEHNYQMMIAAINAVKYQNEIDNFKNIIIEQTTNLTAIKDNLATLKEIDEEEYNELNQTYIENYGKYIEKYSQKVRTILGNKFKEVSKTYLQKLAEKINNTLNTLSTFPDIEGIIGSIWASNMEATSVTTLSDSQSNAIIETVVQRVMNSPDLSPKKIVAQLVEDIQIDPTILLNNQNGQAAKVFTKKRNRKKTFEEAILDNNRILGKMLLDAENAEEMIRNICGEDTKKAQKVIKLLNKLKKDIDSIPRTKQNSKIREMFDDKVRDQLKNTDHMKEFQSYLQKGTKINKLAQDGFAIRPEAIIQGLQGKLQVRITKSSATELVGHYHNQIVECIYNNVPGNINMKDDVYAAIKLASSSITIDDAELQAQLDPIIEEIDQAVKNYMSDYIEKYASRENGNQDRKGTTNVRRARELYVEKMTGLQKTITSIVEAHPELAQALQEYAKNTDTFLSSISAKNYTLYNDDIGFHAGTLGPEFKLGDTSLKALENIQEMYKTGGISVIDMATLEFAILNCSPNAIGAELKPALESYLLGGAALMVFDEGFGEAIPYLENMEASIEALMPKNLNLYLLNEAYVPASYIITSIQTNLSKFYNQELTEGYEEFTSRNRVIITNNASEALVPKTGSLQERFEATAAAAWSQIDIQFIFMAGMLEVFQNLGSVFNVK